MFKYEFFDDEDEEEYNMTIDYTKPTYLVHDVSRMGAFDSLEKALSEAKRQANEDRSGDARVVYRSMKHVTVVRPEVTENVSVADIA